ncbi:hypothetical protein [Lentilactobacillus sunkii]|uniref:Uncharacterized protein n=1 Tax=Lentilactobacillus sunkii DSM 19904 TaxID=1423808 RepID=A0A0R1L1S0_9LACO|nr:hypothetical protein [Lentilactobacillus sunkii]KRK87635.1 hypothetical protein FD17_GL000849 [Lentilactobacillus sunkii DSM 19904]
MTLVWFLAPIVLQLMVNPIADFTAFMILLYTMFNHPIFYLSFFYISEPLTILTFIGTFTNLANPVNWVFNGISFFSKVALPITEFVAFVIAAGIGINTILKGGLLGLVGGFSILGALADLIGLSIGYTLNTLIPNLTLWAVAILWVGLFVIVGVLGVVANLGINVPTWFVYELGVPAGTMLAITLTMVAIVAMLVLDVNALLTALPGVVLKLGLGMISSFFVDPIFTSLGALGLAVTGVVSLIATLAGAFMLAQDWLPSTFNIPTFIFWLIMTNPAWIIGHFTGLIPIIGWIPAIIADIGSFLIGAWGTGLLTVLNFTTWLTSNVPLVLSGIGPILFLVATGLALPLITPFLVVLAIGLLIIPYFLIIPITNPNMIPTLLFAGLVKALTGVVSTIIGDIVSALVKMFNSFPLDNLLVSLLTKLIGSPEGLLQTILSLPLTALKAILQLASGINVALSVIWGIGDLLRSVFGSLIPSVILGALGNLLGIGNLLSDILNTLAILSIANILNAINPLNWLLNGLVTLGLSVASSIVNGIKTALDNIGSLLSNLLQLVLPILNLVRLIGIAAAGFELVGSLIDLLTTPLKMFFDFIKNVVLPFLAISTIANIITTALRLLSMPLLLLAIPLLALLLSGSIINALASLLTPLAILAIAAALPYLLNALSGLLNLVSDILNLIATGLTNGIINLLKSLAVNNGLLKSLLSFVQSLINGGSWITNMFDKVIQLASDILGPLAAPLLLLLKGLGDLIGTVLPILGLIGSLLLPIPIVNVLLAFSFLPDALGSLLGIASRIGDLLKSLGNMILIPIASLILAGLGLLLSPILSSIISPIVKLLLTLPVIGGLIALLANVASALSKNIWTLLGKLASTLINNILNAIFTEIPTLLSSFLNVLAKAGQLLLIALPDILIPTLSSQLSTMFLNGLSTVFKSITGLPYDLFIQPIINSIVNTIAPIVAFLALSLLNLVLSPIKGIFTVLKSIIDTINSQTALNKILQNIVNSVTSVLKGLQTLWLIGLALGSLVSSLISKAVADLTHLITSKLGQLLLNLAGLGYIIFGSNPLNSIGTIISNVGKMWTTSQIVPLVLKGIVQGLMKIGSTFTYFIRGIKHLGDLLVGFAIAPGALGVLGLVNQFIQKAVAAPFQWLFNNILVPLLASALTSSILRFIGPIALLVNLVLSLPGNTFGRLLVAIPLALLSNNIAQWLPAVALAVLGTLLPGLLSNAINLGVQGLPIFGLLVPAILGSIIKGLLIPSSLKWIANLPGLLGQIGSWLLLPLGLKWLAFVPDLIFSAAQNWFNSLLLNTIGTLLLSTLAVNIVRALSKGLGTLITFGLILPGIVFGSNPLEFISLLLKNINFLNGLNKVVPTIISGLLKAIMTISSIAQFIGDLIHNAIDTLLLIVTAPIWLVIPVMNGLSQLSKFANAVLSFVGTLIKNGFSDLIRNIISNLVSGLAGLLANVFKLLISPITNLINGITKLFAFTNWLQNSLNGIFLPLTIANAIGSLVRNAISFLNGLQGLFKLAGSLIYGTALGILQNLLNQSFLGKVLSLLLSGLAFFIPAITGITGLFNTLKNIVGNILKGLINLILSPITALINFIANQLFSGLLTNILKFIYGVQSFFENLPNSLFYVFGLLLPQLLGLLNPLTAGISMLLLPLTLLLGLPMTIGSIITNLVNNALASLIGHLVPTLLNILGNLISGLFNSPLLPIVIPLLKGLNSLIGWLYNTLTAPIEWIKGLIKTFFNGLNNLFKSSPIATILGLILGGLGAFNSLGSLITKIIKPFQDANNFVTFLKGLISNGASLIMTLGAFGLVGINNAVLDLFKALITVPTLLANVINGLLTPLFLSSALTGLKLLVTPAFMFLVEIPLANLINQLVPSIAKAILGLVVPLITSLGFLPTLLLTMAGNQIGFIFSSLPTVLWLTNALSSLIGNTVSFLTKVLNGIKRFITGLLTLPLNALMIGLAVINPLGSLVLAVSAAANALNKLPLTILGWIYDANTKNLSNAIKQFVTPILSTILGVLTYMGLLPLMNLINGIPNFVGSLISTIIPGILTNLIVPQIIGGLVGLVMPVLEFLNFINTALQSAFTLPLLLITAPLWIGLPLLTGIGNLISNVVVPVINFFNNNVLLPLQLLLNDLIANVAGSLLAGLVKLLTYPLAILNAITAGIPGLLLNTLINAATQFISFLNTIPGLISGIAGLLISPIINAIKAIATGLLTNTLNGILNGLNNLVELIDSITSVISTLTDQLIDGLSELINQLVNVWKFGMVTVILALLAGLLPEISVPDWLNNLLDSIIQTAQNVLNFGTSLLIGYLLIKTLAGSLLNNLVLPLILGGLLPLIITGFIQNGISKLVSGLLPLVLLPLLGLLLGSLLNNLVTNGLLSFLLPFLGGLLGAILGGLLNKNNNNNININININGLPLLLALIPLMSILNTIGNGVDLLFKLLGSILPGLIQLLLSGNKVIIVPIILPIIIPLIIPLLLGALLPILLPIILAALLPVILPILIPILLILPIIVWGLPVLIGLIGLLPILIGIPFIISILIPLIIPIIGIGILIGLGSLIFGGTKNTGTINISTIPSSPVIPDGTVNIPGLPNGSTNNGGTSQVPSTGGNNVGGNSQTPSTPSTNNGYNGNGNSSTNSVPAQSSKPSASGLTTPTSGLYAPKSMTNATGLNAQKKLPQTNENDGNQVLTVILGLFLMLIDLLGYVWISHRRKFSMN